MTNGIVLLPFPCRIIPQILSPFRTREVMNLWMPPKFQTGSQWIQIRAPRILPRIPSVLNLMAMRTNCLQQLTGAILVLVLSIQHSLIQILPQPWAIFCNQFVFQTEVRKIIALLVTQLWAMILLVPDSRATASPEVSKTRDS